MTLPSLSGEPKPETVTPQEPELTTAEVQEEVRKYLRLISTVAEPNLSRVRELKEQVEKGTYLTREIIEETASRLALRFLRKE